MHRWIAKEVEIFRAGESVSLDCTDLTDVVAQAEMRLGTVGSTVLSLNFGVRPNGKTTEVDIAHRLTLSSSLMHTTTKSCKGYSVVSLNVLTASGGTIDVAILSIAGFSDHDVHSTKGQFVRIDSPTSGASVNMTCFVAGTRVLMPDGSYAAIEKLQVGEKVASPSRPNTIMGLDYTVLGSRKLVSINDSPAFFSADHAFASDFGWVAADPALLRLTQRNFELECGPVRPMKVGTDLLTKSGFTTVHSLDFVTAEPEKPLFDLKLNGDHTYYADDFVVHNCVEGGPPDP